MKVEISYELIKKFVFAVGYVRKEDESWLQYAFSYSNLYSDLLTNCEIIISVNTNGIEGMNGADKYIAPLSNSFAVSVEEFSVMGQVFAKLKSLGKVIKFHEI